MSIKTKIEKIIAKAKSTDSEAEAASFLAMAERLMEEHQITMLDLGEDDPMGQDVLLEGTDSSPTWQRHLLQALAKYYGATTVRSRFRKGRGVGFKLHVIGPESARVTTELMFPFVLEQVRKYGRESAAEMGLKPEAAIRRVANAKVHDMWRMIRENEDKAPTARTDAATRNALVKVDALQAYLEEKWPNLVSSSSRGTKTNATARAAAGKVSLHRQAGGSSAKQITGR